VSVSCSGFHMQKNGSASVKRYGVFTRYTLRVSDIDTARPRMPMPLV
jgi:hypothetical protein